MKVRRLSDVGQERMGAFVDSLTTQVPDNYPRSILTDEAMSDELPLEVEVEPDRLFERRFEAAAYLYERLAPLRTSAYSQLERDRGVWAWLALLWFDQLCPLDPSGRRKPGERARWIPVLSDARRYYRHLLLGPYLIYHTHAGDPELGEALLCSPLHVGTGEVFRTIIETQNFVTSASVVALIRRLYYDARAGRLVRGAGTKGGSGVRRLGDLLTQLDLTFDLHSITVDDLATLLPEEFHKIGQRTRAG